MTKRISKGQTELIVGIGASAGGLEAIEELLKNIPCKTGAAYVLITHMDPHHKSMLANILSKKIQINILEAENNMPVKPDHVYIIPSDKLMTVSSNRLKLSSRTKHPEEHMSIDFFFSSLAQDKGNKSIGIILSGNGTDGTLGLKTIQDTGGITFVQDEKTAKFNGMPHSAISSGYADFVLSPDEISHQLVKILKHTFRDKFIISKNYHLETKNLSSLNKIFTLLNSATNIDFTHYKRSTIVRRLTQRMISLGIKSISKYLEYLYKKPHEIKMLYQNLTIKVTSFFRNPEAFKILKKKVFPKLLKNKLKDSSIRIWIPGCSTGEEVYSIAIALIEFLGNKAKNTVIQIFGTDISEQALEVARKGVYLENIKEVVSTRQLKDFFTKVNNNYKINKQIRDLCIFARHDITKDYPFTKLDLISCRNTLIYLEKILQSKVIPAFHYALNPESYLMLGTSETIGSYSSLFTLIDKKYKIYSKKFFLLKSNSFNINNQSMTENKINTLKKNKYTANKTIPISFDLYREVNKLILNRYVSASAFINNNLEILELHGNVNDYLELSSGKPTLQILKLAKQGIESDLFSAIHTAKKKSATARKERIIIQNNGNLKEVNIEVIPIKDRAFQENYFLVLFEDTSRIKQQSKEPIKKTKARTGKTKEKAGLDILTDLKQELEESKEHLQHIIEEKDAAVEEAQSSNEELQSTIEELETSKEELQSTNEELITLNEELNTKNLELNQLYNDLTNLLSSSNIPIIILGNDLRIRRFTPTAEKILNLIPGDIGRPLNNIKTNLKLSNLEELINEVIETLSLKEIEVQDLKGSWYILRIRPYRTIDNKIDGAIVTLLTIDELKRTQEELRESKEYFMEIVNTVREPLIVINKELKVESANESFYKIFQMTTEETKNKSIYELGNKQWNIPKLKELLEDIFSKSEEVTGFEIEHDFPKIEKKIMAINGRKMIQKNTHKELILLAIEDITERKITEEKSKLAAVVEFSDNTILTKTLDGIITSWNKGAEKIFGYSKEEIIGKNISLLLPPDKTHEEFKIFERLQKGELIEEYETTRVKKDGTKLFVSLSTAPIKDENNKIIETSKIMRDITKRKLLEEREKELQGQLLQSAKLASIGLLGAGVAHELNSPLTGILGFLRLRLRETPENTKEHEKLTAMVEAGEHMAQIITNLTSFSRESKNESVEINLNNVIDSTLSFSSQALVKNGITIIKNYSKDLLPIKGNKGQLQQVILNILTNAYDAMTNNGEFKISTYNSKDGNNIIAEFIDTGEGIKDNCIAKIFEPFFTTKLPGKGTGLGLFVSKGIIEKHGGKITVENLKDKKGTKFTISLPTFHLK